jgi:hypothetical protein
MSLFGSNNSNMGGRRSNMFSDTNKIVSVTKIVTKVVTVNVTKKIEAIHLLYDNMYNDVGTTIKNIFEAFVTGSEDLKILINYDNYNILADQLYSHFNADNQNLENFRNLLIDAVEGVKHSDNKIKEQEHAYMTLLYAYNSLVEGAGPTALIIESEASMNVTANVKEEIIEYIRLGYQIVDDEGNLIPIDMDILAQIREELNLN